VPCQHCLTRAPLARRRLASRCSGASHRRARTAIEPVLTISAGLLSCASPSAAARWRNSCAPAAASTVRAWRLHCTQHSPPCAVRARAFATKQRITRSLVRWPTSCSRAWPSRSLHPGARSALTHARLPCLAAARAHRRDCIAKPGRRTVRAVRRNRPRCWRIHMRLRELPTRHRLRAARLELLLRRRRAVPRRRGGQQRAGRHSGGRHVRQPPRRRRGVPAAVHAGWRRATMMRRFAMRSCDALKKTAKNSPPTVSLLLSLLAQHLRCACVEKTCLLACAAALMLAQWQRALPCAAPCASHSP
jgi:hypothetical protein